MSRQQIWDKSRLKEVEKQLQLRITEEKKKLQILEKEVTFPFKIILLGGSGVGKSCLLNRYYNDVFSPTFLSTIGSDCKVSQKTKNIKLQIWDTAGNFRFREMTASSISQNDVILICVDLCCSFDESIGEISRFYSMVLTYGHPRSKVIFVGCKYDMKNRIDEMTLMELELFSEERNSMFIPVSAKADINVDYLFLKSVSLAFDRYDTGLLGLTKDSIQLRYYAEDKKRRKCC